jgi:hypothetical protein
MPAEFAGSIHAAVLESAMPAKVLAKKIGKPYSTLLREINPHDQDAELGIETFVEIVKTTGAMETLIYSFVCGVWQHPGSARFSFWPGARLFCRAGRTLRSRPPSKKTRQQRQNEYISASLSPPSSISPTSRASGLFPPGRVKQLDSRRGTGHQPPDMSRGRAPTRVPQPSLASLR